MRIKTILSIFAIALVPLNTFAQNDHSHLNAQQRKLILATGMSVVTPGYVPAGFGISAVFVESDGKWTRYRIVYENGDRCFAIAAASGGIGGDDNPGWKHYTFRSPLGPGTLFAEKDDGAGFTDWFGTPKDHGFFQFVGNSAAPHSSTECKPLPIKEQLKIARSMHRS